MNLCTFINQCFKNKLSLDNDITKFTSVFYQNNSLNIKLNFIKFVYFSFKYLRSNKDIHIYIFYFLKTYG